MVESSPVFADGFGRRVVRVTTADAPPIEYLQLDAVLAGHAGFATALKERAAHLHGRRLTSYARVHRVESDGAGGFAILSDYVKGWRLADVLDVAESENLTFDIGVVMLLLRQLLPTAALLSTQSRDTASGALGPEHLLLTPQARLVLTDYVLGSAIDGLGWPAERLWRTLRVASPLGAESPLVSQRGDVVQVGLTVLSLIVGRRLRDDEFPERLEDLVSSARQKTPSVIHAPLSAPLRDWLLGALQLAPKSFGTLFDAQMALERLLAAEPSLLAQPVELEAAVARFERFMPEFELPTPAAELRLEAPPPGQVPFAVAFDRLPAAKAGATATAAVPAAPIADVAAVPASTRKSGVRRKSVPAATPVSVNAASVAIERASVAWQAPIAAVVEFTPPAPPKAEPMPVPASASDWRGSVSAPADSPPAVAPPAVAQPVIAPPAAAVPVIVRPTVDLPIIAPPAVASYDVGPHYAGPNDGGPNDGGSHAVGPHAVAPYHAVPHHVALPLPNTAWWQSSRAVGALVAVAVAQTLVIGWLLSRPSEGLGGDGELVVRSHPEGAKVLIDDKDRGVTPLTVKVSPGTHVLQVRAGATEPRVIPLQIRAGVQTAQYVELLGVSSTGVLEVRSGPSKAKVTIDGQERGSTPLTLRDLAPGDYQVVLEREGWKSTQTVRVEPGTTAQLVVPIR